MARISVKTKTGAAASADRMRLNDGDLAYSDVYGPGIWQSKESTFFVLFGRRAGHNAPVSRADIKKITPAVLDEALGQLQPRAGGRVSLPTSERAKEDLSSGDAIKIAALTREFFPFYDEDNNFPERKRINRQYGEGVKILAALFAAKAVRDKGLDRDYNRRRYYKNAFVLIGQALAGEKKDATLKLFGDLELPTIRPAAPVRAERLTETGHMLRKAEPTGTASPPIEHTGPDRTQGRTTTPAEAARIVNPAPPEAEPAARPEVRYEIRKGATVAPRITESSEPAQTDRIGRPQRERRLPYWRADEPARVSPADAMNAASDLFTVKPKIDRAAIARRAAEARAPRSEGPPATAPQAQSQPPEQDKAGEQPARRPDAGRQPAPKGRGRDR